LYATGKSPKDVERRPAVVNLDGTTALRAAERSGSANGTAEMGLDSIKQ